MKANHEMNGHGQAAAAAGSSNITASDLGVVALAVDRNLCDIFIDCWLRMQHRTGSSCRGLTSANMIPQNISPRCKTAGVVASSKCEHNNSAPQGAKLEERRHGLEHWLKGALNHPNGRGQQQTRFSSRSHDVVPFSWRCLVFRAAGLPGGWPVPSLQSDN